MALAPIALFVYNRLDHLAKTVEALKNNPLAGESELVVFSDGPKNEKAKQGVAAVREYLKGLGGFKKINIVEREINYGLAKSIIEGVTEIVDKYGKVIVLEDDLVTSPHFLSYMNEALDLYEKDEKVASIHGYIYPVKGSLPETFFIRGADCWGWGTWKRAWSFFEPDGKKLLRGLKKNNATKDFDFYGTYPYTRMLESQIFGLNNSWAIRWYASAFLAGKYTLYPGRSLVNNIGMDASGVHSGDTNAYMVDLTGIPVRIERQEIKENERAKRVIADYFTTLGYNTMWSKVKFFIRRMLLCLEK
jgi:hypothetical protein